MIIALLLFSGIDMIGDLPDRTKAEVKAPITVNKSPDVPVSKVETATKLNETVPQEDLISSSASKENAAKSGEPVSKVKKKAPKKSKADTKSENQPKPKVPEIKLEESSSEDKQPEDSSSKVSEELVNAEDCHYYVYSSSSCGACIRLIAELKANLEDTHITVSAERTTKSGNNVTMVPVLEVYNADTLVYRGIGYIPWDKLHKTIQEKLSASK